VYHINQHFISSAVHMLSLTPGKCMSVPFVKTWNRDGFWYGLEFLLAPVDHWLRGTLCVDWLGLDVMLVLLLGRLARLDCGRWMLFVGLESLSGRMAFGQQALCGVFVIYRLLVVLRDVLLHPFSVMLKHFLELSLQRSQLVCVFFLF
jgi:hypothetical protein